VKDIQSDPQASVEAMMELTSADLRKHGLGFGKIVAMM